MRRLIMLISLVTMVGCTQQASNPSNPRSTPAPQLANRPSTQATPETLRAPTMLPTSVATLLPTAIGERATPTTQPQSTNTPVAAPPFSAPIDLIIASINISRTKIIISQYYGDGEVRQLYEIPCFAEDGCYTVSIYAIPHRRQEFALKIDARGTRLYLVNLEKQTHSQIADDILSFTSRVVAAPDGNTIAFLRVWPEMRHAAPMNETAIWGYNLITKELFAITDWGYQHDAIYWLDAANLVYTTGNIEMHNFKTWQVAIDDLEPPTYLMDGNLLTAVIDPPRWFVLKGQKGVTSVDQYFPLTAETIQYSEPFTKTDFLGQEKTIAMLESPDLRQALLVENDNLLQNSTLTIFKSSSEIKLRIPYEYSYRMLWSLDNRYAFLIGQSTIMPIDTEQAMVFAPIARPSKLNTIDQSMFLVAQGVKHAPRSYATIQAVTVSMPRSIQWTLLRGLCIS